MVDEKSKWERFKSYVKETPDRVEIAVTASLKSAPGEAWQWLKDSINQARDELGKALFHGYAGYMPWPEHQSQDNDKVVPINAPRREPLIESSKQSAQVISIDTLIQAGRAVEGLKIEPPQSISLHSLGNLSPSPSPESARPVQKQKPLTM